MNTPKILKLSAGVGQTVGRTLIDLHSGDPIKDEDLLITIRFMSRMIDVFSPVDCASMPEYAVFVKAATRDFNALSGLLNARCIKSTDVEKEENYV